MNSVFPFTQNLWASPTQLKLTWRWFLANPIKCAILHYLFISGFIWRRVVPNIFVFFFFYSEYLFLKLSVFHSVCVLSFLGIVDKKTWFAHINRRHSNIYQRSTVSVVTHRRFGWVDVAYNIATAPWFGHLRVSGVDGAKNKSGV
jgi:hypothetical protein